MMFGTWGNPDHDDSIRIIHSALDSGINFIDTADVYSAGESEIIVGKALEGPRREDVILATKANASMGEDPNMRGNSRRWLVREVENSLRRLKTDWIDLYQIHRPDPATEHEETLSALTDLVRAGKIRAFGSSTYQAHQMVDAQWIARSRGLGRFVTEQPPYSMLMRGIERDVLPVAQQFKMGVVPWSPLAGGWLTGSFRLGQDPPSTFRSRRTPVGFDLSRPENQLKLQRADALAVLAEKNGMSLVEMAIAFVLAHPAVTSAIIGPRTMDQLESQLGTSDIALSPELLDEIDEICPPGTSTPANSGYQPAELADATLRRRRR